MSHDFGNESSSDGVEMDPALPPTVKMTESIRITTKRARQCGYCCGSFCGGNCGCNGYCITGPIALWSAIAGGGSFVAGGCMGICDLCGCWANSSSSCASMCAPTACCGKFAPWTVVWMVTGGLFGVAGVCLCGMLCVYCGEKHCADATVKCCPNFSEGFRAGAERQDDK